MIRKITYILVLALIFTIPWEDSVTVGALGSIARLIGFAAAGGWLMTIIQEKRFRKLHFFHYTVLLFIIWNILSLIWTVDVSRTTTRIVTYVQLLLLMLMLWEMCREPKDLIAAIQAYVAGGFVSITSTIINYINGRNISTYELRYSATNVNAVELAVLLVLGLPFAWHLFIYFRNDRKNILFTLINLVFIPLAIYTIILTGSRTSLFAAFPIVVYILLSSQVRFSTKFFSLIILTVSVTILYFYLPQSVIDRFGTTLTSISSANLSGRVVLWQQAIGVFSDYPILGAGSGTLAVTIGNAAHNTFLSVNAEVGLVGTLLFALILAVTFWRAANMPKGYSGFWLSVLAAWAIGVLSLSWEFRKPTWLVLSFIIIQGSFFYGRLGRNSEEHSPEAELTSSLGSLENT